MKYLSVNNQSCGLELELSHNEDLIWTRLLILDLKQSFDLIKTQYSKQ